MENINPFKRLEKFIFRIPFLAEEGCDYSYTHSAQFKEAIYLASLELYYELAKRSFDVKSDSYSKHRFTILKYFRRMSSRCTPFGIFAGVGIGDISAVTAVKINPGRCFKTKTRLDMRCLISLYNSLNQIQDIKDKLNFFPNTSLTRIHNSFRYAEIKNGDHRDFQLSEIEYESYIDQILGQCHNGARIDELIQFLEVDGFDKDSAIEFIDSLIENQIIISELEPKPTEGEALQGLIEKLELLKVDFRLLFPLQHIRDSLKLIDDTPIGRPIHLYESIAQTISELTNQRNIKHYFQTDMMVDAESASVSSKLTEQVREVIPILHRLSKRKENPLLREFKEKFYHRYENEEIPLSLALDPDLGISLGLSTSATNDFDSLIRNFPTTTDTTDSSVTAYPKFENLINSKYYESVNNGYAKISLTDDDLKDFPVHWEELSDSLSAIVEVIAPETESSDAILYLEGFRGGSGANWIARFSHLHKDINSFCETIIAKETEKLSKDQLFAEIVHIPDDRLGNVIIHPRYHTYEIPYLAGSSVAKENQISIDDLYVCVPEKQYIKLYSKSLNREIIPRLTNAHNFYFKSLPIYQFICLLQTQNVKHEIFFQWGELLAEAAHLPRIQYKNIILSPEKWHIKEQDLTDIPPPDSDMFYEKIISICRSKGIPRKVVLVFGDNKLPIDFDSEQSVRLLFSITRKRPFIIEEYLFSTPSSFVTSVEDLKCYNNQIILTFIKDNQ